MKKTVHRGLGLVSIPVTAVALLAAAPGASAADPTAAGSTATSSVAPAATSAQTTGAPQHHEPRTKIIGHRGAGGEAPENTVPAFLRGQADGEQALETDVQLSKDGVPFLFHDKNPALTTNVASVFPGREEDPITSFTWAELQKLDVGSYFDDRYTGTRIPALDDVARVNNGRTVINIEIKRPTDSPGVEEKLAEHLQGRSWQRLVRAGHVRVFSGDVDSLRAFHQLAPGIPVFPQPASDALDDETLREYSTWATGVLVGYKDLDQAAISRIRSHGLELQACTVDSPQDMTTMLDAGVDAIYTNYPATLRRVQAHRTPLPLANGIKVEQVNANVPGDDLQAEKGENVVLTNTSHRTVDVSRYVIRNSGGKQLHIGAGYKLAPGTKLAVYTAAGTNTADRYYNGYTQTALPNGGDSVAVLAADPTRSVLSSDLLLRDLYEW